MKTYTINLPDEFAAFVDRAVAEGQWDSVDYLVMAGLAMVQDGIELEASLDQEWLKKEIQKGIDSADRGELLDGPAVMARLRAKLDAAKAQQP
jgi:Arc/MetJ-type ribon-helix-helix transcriptional regulator